MNTLQKSWETYLNEVLVPTAQRQNLPPLPPKIIESFRRCFYCGAATIYMSIVRTDATLKDGPMDPEATFKELREFAADMRAR